MGKRCLVHDTVPKRWGETLVQTSKEMRASVDLICRPYGLSRSRWLALAILDDVPDGLPQKELAAEMGVEGATLVRLLDAMEADGWVSRSVSPEDRRVKIVRNEPKATDFMKVFEREVNTMVDEIFEGIGDEELEACTALLAKIRARIMDWTAAHKG